ncbi:MAG: hypothetical protein KDC24_13580, partial [Saprospiraceae bacterium]|nr:hypothetical protein [Saprospiraceae bacterium]
TALIERYLQGQLSPFDNMAFESAVSTNRLLRRELFLHKKIHRLTLLLGRYISKKRVRKASKDFFQTETGRALLKNIRS